MDVLRYPVASRISATHCRTSFKALRRGCFFTTRSSLSLPFPERNAKHYEELKAAVDVVERACHLCVEVQKSLFSSDGKIVQKIDRTPVTIADFGVQALISLEMAKLFPSIPLVAEEDSTFVRENNLTNAVVEVVKDKSGLGDQQLSQGDVLKAIDRGGKDAYVFGSSPATYWVLDPIDGTRGFVKGREALYVVGLALVVEGEIVLGVMGCPNWQEDYSGRVSRNFQENNNAATRSGIIMISHVGCGTWRRQLRNTQINDIRLSHNWIRCSVDGRCLIHQASFCIPESQTWESLPLSRQFNATTHAQCVGEKQILLLPTCCGSLCKYLMVASGRASVFFQHSRTQRTIMVWDHAVGIICVHEAGGKVTDWRGSELNLATDEKERRVIFPASGILVTNNRIHNQVLELISSS